MQGVYYGTHGPRKDSKDVNSRAASYVVSASPMAMRAMITYYSTLNNFDFP